MGFIDSIVDRFFVTDPNGQVVLRHPAGLKRSYLVKSPAEKANIVSLLKMFYVSHFSITFLGLFLASAWASFVNNDLLGHPSDHVLRTMLSSVILYAIVYGLPELLLWRTFRAGISTITRDMEEAPITPATSKVWWPLLLVGCALLILTGIMALALIKQR